MGDGFRRTPTSTSLPRPRRLPLAPRLFDQLVIWTDATWGPAIHSRSRRPWQRGAGPRPTSTTSGQFGSAGRLRSYTIWTGWRSTRRSDAELPWREQHAQRPRPGIGHRWLAYFESAITPAAIGDCLAATGALERLMDSDASVMEGNDIEDLGGGSFRTAASVRRYSKLASIRDGPHRPGRRAAVLLRPGPSTCPSERQGFGAAGRHPVQWHPPRRPHRGHTSPFMAAVPAAAQYPGASPVICLYREPGRNVDNAQVSKLDRIRRHVRFLLTATEGRIKAETRLVQ